MWVFRNLFWRAFGIWQQYPLSADTRWPFSKFGWGKSRYGSWQAIASFSLSNVSTKLFESPCRWPEWSRARAFLLKLNCIFDPEIFKKIIYWTRWTTGPLILFSFHVPWARSPEPGKVASLCPVLFHHFSPCNIFSMTSFWSIRQNWFKFAMMYRGFQTMLPTEI